MWSCKIKPKQDTAINHSLNTHNWRRKPMQIANLDQTTQTALEAAVLRRFIAHLETRTDVQNIELMNLAGFCRNCLSKWYVAAANERGITLDYEAARTRIYGMPYEEWKLQYQTPASVEQLAEFSKKMD
jgi:uncharacterized protein